MRRISFALATATAFLLVGTWSAEAQSVPHRVRGTIAEVSADAIIVHTTAGTDETVKLAPDARIGSDRVLALADIKPGDYIGTAAQKEADGRLVAIEVTVFPEALRGVGEGGGHRTKAGGVIRLEQKTPAEIERLRLLVRRRYLRSLHIPSRSNSSQIPRISSRNNFSSSSVVAVVIRNPRVRLAAGLRLQVPLRPGNCSRAAR